MIETTSNLPESPHTPVSDVAISAIVCTHNRAPYLRKALASLGRQTLDRRAYEVIVVDNRSTDDTKQTAADAAAALPSVRYLYEPALGLSRARNTGWQQAKGRYIAFLDDDAIASPQWLEELLQAFESTTPRPGAVGGRIDPIWEAPRPSWLSDRVALGLTILDWSTAPMFLTADQWLAGANVAYPRDLLAAAGGFETSLGRSGSNLISCEETLLHDRLNALGHRLYYQPGASVQHHISASRLTKPWHLRRHYWNGISMATAQRLQTPLSVAERLKRAWTSVWRHGFAMRVARKFAAERGHVREDERFELRCQMLYNLGYARGMLSRAGT